MIKMLELNHPLIRKKTVQQKIYRNELNIPKVKEFKRTIILSKPNARNKQRNSIKRNFNLNNFHYSKKDFSTLLNESRKISRRALKSKTQKYFEKSELRNEDIFNKSNNLVSSVSSKKLNKIGISIIQKINNMKEEIENNNKKRLSSNLINFSPENLNKEKLLSFKTQGIKKKTKNARKSVLIKDISFENQVEEANNKISKTFVVKENKIDFFLNKINKKISQKSNDKLDVIDEEETKESISSDDDTDNNEDLKGYSFSPNSNFIFIFDLIIIIVNLFSFISIPIDIARNKDIKKLESSIPGKFYYCIDLFYIFDLILSFFRGYYNYEFEIVRNNRKIVSHYLFEFFIFDLIEAIPIYSITRMLILQIDKIHYGLSEKILSIFIPLLLIKPFKIFKILRRKHNKALEDLYTYLSENYYLENFVNFLIYFIVFLLFVHLFICFHIFFTFQSFPNWIDHINITNETFFDKYIASLYFMVTTMTTVGYGDIVCISQIERIYHIILLVIGTLFYTFLVSKLGNYLGEESHEKSKLDKDLNILENLRITYPTMSFKLYTKIKKHLISIFNKRKKIGVSLLFNGIPDAIKNDLLFKIYSNVINGFIIFKDVNNSRFVYQILTSFIPIISKKEEIIVLEGEMIENIVFVKDGRLSIEIAIDINDPYKSIKKYAEINFIGITKQEEIKNYNYMNRLKSAKSRKNFNDLKDEINNMLIENKNVSNINNSINNNGISVDLGRMDFSRSDIEYNEMENFQIIKVLDIRKNEHYGDIHIFIEKPSPFTLKTNSRIAELLILRKHDASVISKNFPNIWKRIQNKSYHNLVSIKNLTFKILMQYYNTYISNGNIKDKSINLNLDITKNSVNENSMIQKQGFRRALTQINKDRNIKSSKQDDNNDNTDNNDNNDNINTNKLHVHFKSKKENNNLSKKRISEDSFGNELNYSYESMKSNDMKNSQFKFTLSILKSKHDDISSTKNSNIIMPPNKENIISSNLNFTFKKEDMTPKKLSNNNMNEMKFKDSRFKANQTNNKNILGDNNSKLPIQQDNNNSLKSESSIYSSSNKTEKIEEENSSKCFITLKNINANFSKQIRKKILKRKKLQNLKKLIKIKKSYNKKSKQNLESNKNSDSLIIENNINYSICSSNNKILSQLSEITEGDFSSSIIKIPTFPLESFKIELSESFEIKSSYCNINLLTKGEMIKNIKYKNFIENLIKNQYNKYKNNDNNNKQKITLISNATKKENKNDECLKFYEGENKTFKDDIFFSDGRLISFPKKNRTNALSEESNNLSTKKLENNNYQVTQTFENPSNSLSNKKINQKFKRFSKNMEKPDNREKNKTNDTESKRQEMINSKNYNIEPRTVKKDSNRKILFDSYSNKIKKENNNNLKGNNTINKLYKYLDYNNKDLNSNASKNSSINKSNNYDNSFSNIFDKNNNEDERMKNCILY